MCTCLRQSCKHNSFDNLDSPPQCIRDKPCSKITDELLHAESNIKCEVTGYNCKYYHFFNSDGCNNICMVKKPRLNADNKWNTSVGYTDDQVKHFESFTHDKYIEFDDFDKTSWIEYLLLKYNEIGIFPISYLSDDEIKNEIVKAYHFIPKYDAVGGEIIINTGMGIATKICNYLMPNMYNVIHIRWNKGIKDAISKFTNPNGLRYAIKFALDFCDNASPKNVMAGIRMLGAMPTNFRPMNVKALLNRYCPIGGTYYDYAMGFGGRLLGTGAGNIKDYKYIGTDPNTETFTNLKKLKGYINEVIPRFKATLHNKCSEDLILASDSIDYAFSSPPYFNLETYSSDETQSYNKFNNLDSWIENYMKPTIQNIWNGLKNDRWFQMNLADFKGKSREIKIVDKIIKIAEEIGFIYDGTLTLTVPKRAGQYDRTETTEIDINGEIIKEEKMKKEGILSFKKGNPKIYAVVYEEVSLF